MLSTKRCYVSTGDALQKKISKNYCKIIIHTTFHLFRVENHVFLPLVLFADAEALVALIEALSVMSVDGVGSEKNIALLNGQLIVERMAMWHQRRQWRRRSPAVGRRNLRNRNHSIWASRPAAPSPSVCHLQLNMRNPEKPCSTCACCSESVRVCRCQAVMSKYTFM